MTDNIKQESQRTAEARNDLRQITRNAYRVLGLPADASCRAISDRGATLHRAAKAGIPRHSAWNFEWHGPLRRDEVAISGALGRLRDPRQRLTERLFWIAQSEIFVKHIPTQNIDASVESLRASYSSQSHHDAAVLALISCSSIDPKVDNPQRWTEMLQLWVDALTCEKFWSEFLEAEDAGDFEPAASPEELAELRADSLRLIAEPMAELARDAASRRDFDRCGRLLEVVRRSGLPGAVISAIEEEVLGPYEDALSRLVQDITKTCWNAVRQDRQSVAANKQVCSVAVNRWRQEVEPRYEEFLDMIGRLTSAHQERATDEYANFLTSLGNACTWADEWVEAEAIFTEARDHMLSTNPAWDRIEASLRNIAHAAVQHRLRAESDAEQNPNFINSQDSIDKETRSRSNSPASQDQTNQSTHGGHSGFVEFCRMLENRIRQLQTNDRDNEEKLVSLETVYADFKNRAVPWMATILAVHRDNGHVCKSVRNIAAQCLSTLAGAFLYFNDRNAARRVCTDAFTLVVDDDELERLIIVQFECSSEEASTACGCDDRFGETPQQKSSTDRKGVDTSRDLPTPHLSRRRTCRRFAAAAILSLLVIGMSILSDRLSLGWHPASESTKSEALVAVPTPARSSTDFGDAANYSVTFTPSKPQDPALRRREVVPSSRPRASQHTGEDREPVSLPDGTAARPMPNLEALAKKYNVRISDKPPADVPIDQIVELVPATGSGSTPPSSERRAPFSLSNGTNLVEPPDITGLGRLIISNYSHDDAVVKLKSAVDGKTVRFVYVRAMANLDISGISPGEYLLQFSSGRDWDAAMSAFRENQTFAQFGRSLRFTEEPEGDYIRYSKHTVTLQTVPNGNVEKRTITAADFNS